MNIEDWNKLKSELMKLHPIERLKKLHALLEQEQPPEIAEDITLMIEDAKKAMHVEDVVENPVVSNTSFIEIDIPPKVAEARANFSNTNLDEQISSDIDAIAKNEPDINYNTQKNDVKYESSKNNPEQNTNSPLLDGYSSAKNEELVEKIGRTDFSEDSEQKENLIKTDYMSKDIKKYIKEDI